MAFLSKLKDIFYDKVEVDEPEEENESFDTLSTREVREEKPLVREIKPKEDEEDEKPLIDLSDDKDDSFSERDLFRNERTFNFTEFDDTDELPPRKSVLDLEDTKPVVVQKTAVEPVKVFKPSPIISPIYGILDKDYKKEEVAERTVTSEPLTSTVTTYDTVRRKAYGTLEDDLEDTLNSMNKITTTSINIKMEEKPVKEAKEVKEEINEKTQNIEDLITRIEETTNDIDRTLSIGQLEDTAELENFEEDNDAVIGGPEPEVEPKVEEKEDELDRTMTDSTLEHDLFNLIDSMYDDKED
jgi:hypothetical protein